MSSGRQHRRKQDISTLSSEPEFPPLPKRQWAVPPSSTMAASELGIWTDGSNDLEDDELHFRGFSYTCSNINTLGGDAKSRLNNFACQKCPAIFGSRIGLTNHGKLHGARLPLGCDQCDFSCTNSKTLRQHRRAHGLLPRRRRPMAQQRTSTVVETAIAATIFEEREPLNLDIVVGEGSAVDEGIFDDPNDGDEADVDADTFGDPPVLSRATLTSAGLEEEEEDNDDGEQHQKQQHLFPSTSAASSSNAAAATTTTKPSSNGTAAAPGRRKQQRKTTTATTRTNASSPPAAEMEDGGSGGGNQRRQKSGANNYGLIRCTKCPFTTPSRVRLQSHMNGHYRSTGFVCSVCGYKHESAGWLHLHCILHQREEESDAAVPSFQWPPVYVTAPPLPKKDGADDEAAGGTTRTTIINVELEE